MGFMDLTQQIDEAGRIIPDNIWEKWGGAAFRGYQAVPHDLFKFQAQLDLSNGELVTLLNILDFWWEADNRPFPGATVLAKRMNTNPRSVHRHLKTLQEKKYAVRERGNDEKRRFNLDGLVGRLTELVSQQVTYVAEGEKRQRHAATESSRLQGQVISVEVAGSRPVVLPGREKKGPGNGA